MHNTWLRIARTAAIQQMLPAERLEAVFEEVGIAIAVTSLTNAFGFGLGCIAPVPEIRLFCAVVSLAMLLDLVFQVRYLSVVLVFMYIVEFRSFFLLPSLSCSRDTSNLT
jgi:predicted RND superfamily exporter protein